jgi:type IV secretion system protein VirB11
MGKIAQLSPLLERNLEPLAGYLRTPGLIELCINKPGEVLLETADGWTRKRAPELDLKTLMHLARTLATESGQEFSDHVPMLSCFLPGYGYRVQVIAGAMTDSGFSLSIRAGAARTFPLESYMPKADAQRLEAAVRARKNILISGGTSTGKTTMLNSLLKFMDPEDRVITVEDTKELIVPNHNAVRILKSKTGTDIAAISYKDIINACMRLRPDRILMGELDVENTPPFLRLINTGHAGSMTTVHADSPREAIDAICMNAQLAGHSGPVERYATKALDIVVQLERVSRTKVRARAEYIKAA